MSRKRVTSKMVAERAGVSQTTVSFVLNNVEGQTISEETVLRVRKAAQELGYMPNAVARSLARGTSNNIALVLTQPHEAVFSDEYVSYVLTGIVQVASARNFRLFVEVVDTLKQSEAYTSLARGNEVAGLLVLPYHSREHDVANMLKLIEDDFPIVSLGRTSPDQPEPEDLTSVLINSSYGIRQGMAHLLEMGYERIATISYAPKGSTHEAEHRTLIYRTVLSEYGISYQDDFVQHGNYLPQTGQQAAETLLDLANPPTAIVAQNDVMAMGAIAAIHQRGLRVPDDIAVVGYDGIHLAPYVSPALTTIQAPNVRQGQLGAEMLFDQINNIPLEVRHVELQPELIIRESCGYNLKYLD